MVLHIQFYRYQNICFCYSLKNFYQKDMIETIFLSDLKILEKSFFIVECHGLQCQQQIHENHFSQQTRIKTCQYYICQAGKSSVCLMNLAKTRLIFIQHVIIRQSDKGFSIYAYDNYIFNQDKDNVVLWWLSLLHNFIQQRLKSCSQCIGGYRWLGSL